MSHDCGTGCGRPTTTNLCTHCSRELEDALATLGAWTKAPEPLNAYCDLATRETHNHYGGQPSSAFDTSGGSDAAGRTKGLAAELDVQRSRQARRGSMNGPRLPADSKVWWPWQSKEWDLNRPAPSSPGGASWRPGRSHIDRAEGDLARAVALWIGLLHGVNVSAPGVVGSGHVLARGCTWLLWHIRDVTRHPRAAEAHRSFVQSAKAISRLVDRPEDQVYVGPCWRVGDDGSECVGELKAKPGQASVQCRVCGHVVGVVERKAWLADHLEEVELTATNCSRALAQIGLTVSRSHIDVWATRGSLISRGRVNSGGRSLALYRVGDVMLLAYKRAEDPRARAQTRQSA